MLHHRCHNSATSTHIAAIDCRAIGTASRSRLCAHGGGGRWASGYLTVRYVYTRAEKIRPSTLDKDIKAAGVTAYGDELKHSQCQGSPSNTIQLTITHNTVRTTHHSKQEQQAPTGPRQPAPLPHSRRGGVCAVLLWCQVGCFSMS